MSEARLLLTPGVVLYTGPGVAAARHRHYAIQLSWGLEASLQLELEGREVSTRAVLIPSGTDHAFRSEGRTVIALVEPQGGRGRRLHETSRQLSGEDAAPLLAGLGPPSPDLGLDGATAWCDRLIEALTGPGAAPSGPGPIVRDALAYLDRTMAGTPRLDEAALAASVSPSRLTHLFTAQVGIPFRRYVLWLRLRRVVEEIGAGANLTEAAIAAGFADSAHLSRTFKDTFGLPPSSALAQMEIAARPERSSAG